MKKFISHGLTSSDSPNNTDGVSFPVTALSVAFPVTVDSTNFPNATWREYVNMHFAAGDSVFTQTEAEVVTNISVNNLNITDLTGVECFTNVTNLYCLNNALTSLDVRSLSSLRALSCSKNSLTSLRVSGLASLEAIFCENNSLTSLDLTGLSSLTNLYCGRNTLTSLDVTGPITLADLRCHDNALLEVIGLPHSLATLDGTNQTRTISMEPDGLGGYVSVDSYPLQATNILGALESGATYEVRTGKFHADAVPTTSLFSTSLSGTGLSVSGTLTFSLVGTVPYEANPIAVDATNFPDATWRASVYYRFAGKTDILTQTEAEAVTIISVINLGITDLTGIEYFTNVTYLECVANSLTSLDVTALVDIENLNCSINALTSLNVAGLTSLEELICSTNSLTSLDAATLTSLEYLDCQGNSLTSLDVSGVVKLDFLDCSVNSLTSIDVATLTSLRTLRCIENSLATLDVTGLTNLRSIHCSDNSLLEVIGLPHPLATFVVDNQTRTIPMEPDELGGFVSVDSYPLQATNTLGGLDVGVTYDALTGRFHADAVPRTSPFSTSLLGTGHVVSGTLTFS